jgi:hypothetical protein
LEWANQDRAPGGQVDDETNARTVPTPFVSGMNPCAVFEIITRKNSIRFRKYYPESFDKNSLQYPPNRSRLSERTDS